MIWEAFHWSVILLIIYCKKLNDRNWICSYYPKLWFKTMYMNKSSPRCKTVVSHLEIYKTFCLVRCLTKEIKEKYVSDFQVLDWLINMHGLPDTAVTPGVRKHLAGKLMIYCCCFVLGYFLIFFSLPLVNIYRWIVFI